MDDPVQGDQLKSVERLEEEKKTIADHLDIFLLTR